MKVPRKETDLYPPVKRYLESQGYTVKGEITDCDVVAVRPGEEPVIVELKLTLNLNVVLQAVARQRVSNAVYVGVPRRCSALRSQRRHVLRRMERQDHRHGAAAGLPAQTPPGKVVHQLD